MNIDSCKGKTLISLLLIFVLVISAFGCTKSGSNQGANNSGSDQQNTSEVNMSFNNASDFLDNSSFYGATGHAISETDSGYFVMKDSTLHYVDKATGQSVIFSNDPISEEEMIDKLHLEPGFEHSARFDYASSVFFYKGKIYLMNAAQGDSPKERELLMIDPQTHERTVIAKTKMQGTEFVLVEGKAYWVATSFINKSGEIVAADDFQSSQDVTDIQVKYSLEGYDIDNNTIIEPIEVDTPEGYLMERSNFQTISSYQDKVCFVINFDKSESNSQGFQDKEKSKVESILYLYNANTKEFSKIYLQQIPENKETEIYSYALLDDKIYFAKRSLFDFQGGTDQEYSTYYNNWSKENSVLEVADLNGETLKELPSLDGQFKIISNGKDLFAVSVLQFNTERKKIPVEIYKLSDGKWEQYYTVQPEDTGEFGFENVMIDSAGVLFLNNFNELYMVKDGKVIEVINYT